MLNVQIPTPVGSLFGLAVSRVQAVGASITVFRCKDCGWKVRPTACVATIK